MNRDVQEIHSTQQFVMILWVWLNWTIWRRDETVKTPSAKFSVRYVAGYLANVIPTPNYHVNSFASVKKTPQTSLKIFCFSN